ARIATYRLDIVRHAASAPGSGGEWRIANEELLSSVEGLFQLQLNPAKQFAVRNLAVVAEDATIAFSSGKAFVAETPTGPTALVVVGNGELRFTPEPESERGQLRLFCGQERLFAPITAAFIRLNPQEFDQRVQSSALSAERVDARELARAQPLFEEGVAAAFALDLGDISAGTWSLVPTVGDFLADVRTRKYGTLTFSIATSEPESIQLFDRKRRRTISTYAPRAIRETRGVAFDEDQLADYDVIDYDIDATLNPTTEWLEGLVRVKLRSKRDALSTITLRLEEALTIASVTSLEYGRLLAIRIKGQNSFIANLPEPLERDDVLVLQVAYSGRAPLVEPDREVASMIRQEAEMPLIEPEPRYLLSNRSFWYPQAMHTDFATARMRLTAPAPFISVASGSPSAEGPRRKPPTTSGEPTLITFEFVVGQPLRYLSWVVAEMESVVERSVTVELRTEGVDTTAHPGPRYTGFDLTVTAHPRQVRRAGAAGQLVEEVMTFYAGLVDDVPFPTLTVALVDNDVPGGHSPGYYILLYQPLPTSRFAWRGDPVNFDSFPEFFLAHELAHQFWGQAVGWKSYHEQWISEGFAQYFAALYAETRESKTVLAGVLNRMRRSVLDNESQGPIFLGYRLGHIQDHSRVFRGIVYNKGAMVLHMLRRLIGDEPFFEGLRRVYWAGRFAKIGTDDVRSAFQSVTTLPLERFFDQWVYRSALPSIKWSWAAAGTPSRSSSPGIQVRFEQSGPTAFMLPVTVTVTYVDGSTDDHTVVITEPVVDVRLATRLGVRRVQVNGDSASLGRFSTS
ncbi:MAG: M1 family metallopeptidase, partial [Vicinamibacterales bacterium]